MTYWECVLCALQGWAKLYLFLFYDFYWQMEDLPKVKIASFVILSWFVSCLIFCLIICCQHDIFGSQEQDTAVKGVTGHEKEGGDLFTERIEWGENLRKLWL